MDKLLNKSTFKHINKSLNENQYKNLRILCVFGGYGLDRSMIYVTEEDEVYGTGENECGCLGVGLNHRFVYWPEVNTTLSHKQLVDIECGFNHCLGLTRDGLLYSWGSNKWGQLGVGLHPEMSAIPLLVDKLSDKRVVQISCGNAFTLVVTQSGEVYGWGKNHMGQVGNRTFEDVYWPTYIPFYSPVLSVSCGKTHSLALVAEGLVFVWGNNKFGQLGQKPVIGRKGLVLSNNRPKLLQSIAIYEITKAVCGPNNALLLTSDGDIYSFGLNDCGQVGNGTQNDQYFPIKVNNGMKFKDIFATYKCHISIGLSVKNKYYYWGLCGEKKILRPKEVPNVGLQSVHEIFTNNAEYKITYSAIVNINEDNVVSHKTNDSLKDNLTNTPIEDKTIESNDLKSFDFNKLSIASNQCLNCCEVSETTDSLSIEALKPELLNNLCEPFNKSVDNVIRFKIDNQYIYGHKEYFKIRNNKLWLKCMQLLKANNEIRVNHYSYKSFYAFIQYLYTNRIDIDCESVADLLSLANTYDEELLKEECLQSVLNIIDSTNVCQLFTTAFEQNIQELREICLRFVANNFKHCLSQEFLQLDEKLSTNLLISSLLMTQEFQDSNNPLSERSNDYMI